MHWHFKSLDSISQTCSLTVEEFTADAIALRYEGLGGNQPHRYQNFVAVWESTAIPWNAPPLSRQRIPQNDQMGTVVIGADVSNNAYIAGYAVGDRITDICAVAYISPTTELLTVPDRVRVSVAQVGENSLLVNYTTLPGYLPKTYRNWIGLWEGFASPYNAITPIGKTEVYSDASQGTVEICNIQLSVGRVYTLIYFMGHDRFKHDCENIWHRAFTKAAAVFDFQIIAGEAFRSE